MLKEHLSWSLPVSCLTGHSVDHMSQHKHWQTSRPPPLCFSLSITLSLLLSPHVPSFCFSIKPSCVSFLSPHAGSMCQADVKSAWVGTAGLWFSFPSTFIPVPIMPPPLALPRLIGVALQPRPPYLTSPHPSHLDASCTIWHNGTIQHSSLHFWVI